jgi:hypothetical protein
MANSREWLMMVIRVIDASCSSRTLFDETARKRSS